MEEIFRQMPRFSRMYPEEHFVQVVEVGVYWMQPLVVFYKQ